MRKVGFGNECSPSKIPVRSRESNGMTTTRMPESSGIATARMEQLRRLELDNETIQVTSPLRRIELREKSVPGIGSLYGIDSTVTTLPAIIPGYQTDSKDKYIAAMEENCRKRNQALKDAASNFSPRGESIQELQSIRRIDSTDKSIHDLERISAPEAANSSSPPLSPIHKVKPPNIIIPPIRSLRRTDSEETIVPTPVKTCRFSDETIVQSPVATRRSSNDNGSPSLRKMRSAISILSLSPLAGLKKLPPQATSLLRAICLFDPTDVRPRYLEAICARYSSKAGQLEATLTHFPVKPNDLQSTLNQLKQEKLITSPAYALGIRVKDEVRQEVLKQLKNTPEIFEVGFKTVVFVLYELWPSMMEPRKSELNFDEYAQHNLWGGRDDLVIHVMALKNLFDNAKGAIMERCASRRYMVLLVEVAW